MRNLLYGLSIALVALLLGCQTPAAPTKPLITLISPPQGSVFQAGEQVAVHSSITDASGIARVELYVDGAVVAQDVPPGSPPPQFQVIQYWNAVGAGQHTLLVRAVNTANATNDAGVTISVQTQTSLLTPTATDAPVPTNVPLASNTVRALATLPPPTDAPAASNTPTASNTPSPSHTPKPPPTAPIVDLPPFDGGMHVIAIYGGGDFLIQVTAHAGGDDGFNIDHVEMFVQDLNGKVIATKREDNSPYCFFGEANGECAAAHVGTNAFQWGNGRPIQPGWYLIRGVAYSKDHRIRTDERAVRITIPPNDLENFFVEIDAPGDQDRVRDELPYQASVSGSGVNGETGQGIDHVDLFVVQYNGEIVSATREKFAPYCGFADEVQNTTCRIWNFKQRGGKWQSGAPVHLTQYLVRVIAYAQDGRIAAYSQMFQVDSIQ